MALQLGAPAGEIGYARSNFGKAIQKERSEERTEGPVEGRDEPDVRCRQAEGQGPSCRDDVERIVRTLVVQRHFQGRPRATFGSIAASPCIASGAGRPKKKPCAWVQPAAVKS